MKIKEKIIAIILILISLNIICYSQNINKYTIDRLQIQDDSIFISFLGGFEYDLVFIYVNDIRIFEGLLYSSSSLGCAYKTLKVPYLKGDSLKIWFQFFERDIKASLEYNPLWWSWSPENDNSIYFAKKELIFQVDPKKDGKYIGIGVKPVSNSIWDETIKRWLILQPFYRISRTPFIFE
jgi:hypothetical protein